MKVIILIMFVFATSFAQGKIFTKEAANEKFGKVISSKKVETRILEDYAAGNEKIMFRLKAEKLNVLTEQRSSLLKSFEINENDVYHLFSSKLIQELVTKGGEDTTTIEIRSSYSKDNSTEPILSITNGAYTLEASLFCPPYCD